MKKIIIWITFAFVFAIPLSQYVSVRLLLLLVLLSVFVFRTRIFRHVLEHSWDLLFYLLVLIAGLIYSEDKIQGLKVIETSFSLAAIGFLFFDLLHNRKNVSRYVMAIFTVGVLVTCVIITLNSAINYLTIHSEEVFFFYELTDIVGLQPTYMAFYVIVSMTYIIFVIYYNKEISLFLPSICVLFLFVILLLTGGKTIFICVILIFSFFLLKYLLDVKSRRKTYVIVLVTTIMISLLTVSNSNYFNNITSHRTDFWERSILWGSAIKANSNPFFGVGTGDYNLVLNQYYSSQGLHEFADGNYNSHNQFIQLYFSNGIFGVIALLIMMGRPLYLSFKSQNPFGILILFPFVMYGMTEVFLGRYQGVILFALCHQIVVSQYYSSKQVVNY